jgi:hypothetical protein
LVDGLEDLRRELDADLDLLLADLAVDGRLDMGGVVAEQSQVIEAVEELLRQHVSRDDRARRKCASCGHRMYC